MDVEHKFVKYVDSLGLWMDRVETDMYKMKPDELEQLEAMCPINRSDTFALEMAKRILSEMIPLKKRGKGLNLES